MKKVNNCVSYNKRHIKAEQKSFDVRYFKSGADSAVILAGKNPEGMPDG